jgi:hypothetical protein
MLSGSLSASHDNSHRHGRDKEVNLGITEAPSLVSPSKSTSNAIPEAEESTLEALRKYAAKKTETQPQVEQLEKPYTFAGSQDPVDIETNADEELKDTLDNDIHQLKRSGVPKPKPISTLESDTGFTTQDSIRSESEYESIGLLTSSTSYISTEASTIADDTDLTTAPDKTTTPNDQSSRATSPDTQGILTLSLYSRF